MNSLPELMRIYLWISIETLEEGHEDSIRFYEFPRIDSRKISSTNMIKRLNLEIHKGSSLVGIFLSTDSYVRLVTSYLIEYILEDRMANQRRLN
ncbi:transposase [Clostridia bacterium]|nr:transposase [Clostridia bacterium]